MIENKYTESTAVEEIDGEQLDDDVIKDAKLAADTAEVISLQKKWADKVTEKTPEFITNLMSQGLVPTIRDKSGNIIACFYQEPLNREGNEETPEKLIYRWGGFVTAGDAESKKAALELVRRETQTAIDKETRVIACVSHPTLTKMLTSVGWLELSYDECKKKFPEYLNSYLNKSNKPAKHYKGKAFYILPPNE